MIELPLLGQQSNTLSQLTPSVKRSGRKYVVYFNEFNLVLGKSRYFPVVSGILRAYAETVPEIRNRYEFMPFLFQWDSVDNILAQYTKPPDIAAFSANMWNENLNLRVAQEVKKRWPKCTIVFGGYCVPRKAETYMRENSFIDICVRGEGEDTFLDILLNYMEDWDSENFHEDYTHIPNTSSYKFDSKEIVENTNCRPFQKDMDQYPSPYLEGHFNYLVDSYKDITWQAIIENARGCSFPCSFCVAFGTEVVTMEGRKPIQNVKPGEKVLGWDENTDSLTWNEVEFVLHNGRKNVLRVQAEDLPHVEATSDHKFYTPDGWVEAGELRSGDRVLLSLWGEESQTKHNDLFGTMSKEKVVRINEGETGSRESTERQNVRRGPCQSLREDEGCEPYEAERSSGKTECHYQSKDRLWRNNSIYADGMGSCSYECYGKGEAVRSEQSDEGSYYSSKNGSDFEGAVVRGNFFKDEGVQSYAGSSCEGEGEELGEQPRGCKKIQTGANEGILPAPERVREKSDGIFEGEQTSLQVHGGFQLVGRSMQIGELSEPGFYMQEERDQPGNPGTRNLLAQGCKRGSERDRGLQKCGLGGSSDLGGRKVGREDDKRYPAVRWVKITSITQIGKRSVYDIVNASPHPNFFANGILVHNCAWGRFGATTKYRFHSLNRVKEEIDWVVNYGKCEYMFCADANFLMHPRDMEIVDHLVEVKKTSGRDIKWRACYGKNSDEKIFRGALKLYQHGIEKGVTLARQSNDPTTLKNIRRQNISLGTYRNLQERFNDEGVPVYIELIIGLPGETKESWKKGIDDSLLRTGMKVTLFTHMCQVFANTEMYEPEYQEKYGIKTQKIVLTEMHASPRKEGWVDEYETIVIATDSLPHEDWREVCQLSWLTLFIHSMKAGVFVLGWLWDRFNITPSEYVDFLLHKSKSESLLGKELKIWDGILDRIVGGESRGTILSQYLDVYLEVEEAALLRCSEAWEVFYRDLAARTLEFLRARGIDALNPIELIEVIDYQRARMPSFEAPEIREQEYTLNIPEYFDKLFGSSPVPLERKLQILSLKPKTWANKEQYARETVLWGRKSGTLLVECSYEDEKSGEA